MLWGAGPRASQYLVLGAKARAVLRGRHYAGQEDIQAVAAPVLRHRIKTNFNADAEGITGIISQVPGEEDFGFWSIVLRGFADTRPDHVMCCFDVGRSFRADRYEGYKATRKPTPDDLRAHYVDLLGDPDTGIVPDDVVFYCGSGVTAAHDLLAMEIAGLGEHRLYPGSWSEWIRDEKRPIGLGSA